MRLPLRQPWDHKPYGSCPKILQVEVTYCSAVVATQSHCSYRQILFGSHPIYTENISHVSITDHSCASRTFRGPIHLVGHLNLAGRKTSGTGQGYVRPLNRDENNPLVWSVVASHWVERSVFFLNVLVQQFQVRVTFPRLNKQDDETTIIQVRIFIVECEHGQKTNTSGEVHQMRSASLQGRTIIQPWEQDYKREDIWLSMALIRSTMDETDWKECPKCTGHSSTGNKQCDSRESGRIQHATW